MNIKDRMIIEEYRSEILNFQKLEVEVYNKLESVVKSSGIFVNQIQHRLKSEKSLVGKLYKRGENFHKLSDLTDILGVRVITYFGDDVDKIGKIIEQNFKINWEDSTDKRANIKADTFGYLSLHYIASLRVEDGYDEALCNKEFEIQIRTVLQHAWSDIEHDIGYKSDYGVPREVARIFARIAGLLEIADSEFIRNRDIMKDYIQDTKQKIASDDAEDVLINMVSLQEYMMVNSKMRSFLNELSAIEGSDIFETDPEVYIEQLKFLGINKIGQVQAMLNRNHDVALKLAKLLLSGSEIDIISSNVALRFLCRAELVMKNYSEEDITKFNNLTSKNNDRSKRQAKTLIKNYQTILQNDEI